jgi:hypothetical protein
MVVTRSLRVMAVEFVAYVRSVEGFAVPRYGTQELIGATRVAPKHRTGTVGSIVWDTERIVPLTAEYMRKYAKEMRGHLRNKELVSVSHHEWVEQVSAPLEVTE